MSHRAVQARQSATKGFAKMQKVFVAKNQDHNHNHNHSPAPKEPTPSATLSNSLRQSLSRQSGGGSFVNYLPQDEAVAAGLGADEGGLDPVESQRVVDLLNRELSRLLKLSPKEFWREVASDTSLHEFLDSFLQFRSRWYDFPHRGAKEMVAGVIVGELELSRRVFMVLYRISSNRDPGARAANSLSPNDHGVLLQEKLLLDLPKLLDICAIYGHENEDLTRVLVRNALSAQPWIHDSLTSVISHFLSIVDTMQQRCSSSLQALFSSRSRGEHGSNQLYADMLEVMDFINDAIVSMDAFVSAYKPAAVFFSFPVEIRDGNEELLCTLAKLHDSLIPSFQRGFRIMLSSGEDANVCNIHTGLSLLAMRIIKFGWNLLDFCYLSDEVFGEDLPIPAATKMFPANIEDPFVRADILVQTFREISAVSVSTQDNQNRQTLLQNIEKNFHLMSKLKNLQSTGWIFMDDEQLQYVSGIFMYSRNATKPTTKDLPSSQPPATSNKHETDEDAIIVESKVSQIKDLFPDCGKGFLAACLEAYNQNPEEVIQRILEGTLHEDLQRLDISLETMPTSKTAVTVSKNDKGKGKLVETAPVVSSNIVAGRSVQQSAGPSVSSSSSVGRFVRKSKEDGPDSHTLDARNEKDSARTAALVSQYEYEDEYDDSFDDLGLSVAESGLVENEILGDKMSSNRGKSWGRGEKEVETYSQNPSDSSRWGSRKKPQYYVKDGKNYSYKVEGSIAVANASEASLVNQAQEELIYGLGRGGNLPLGAVKQLMEANEDQEKLQDVSETEGRRFGSGRGRGRRGGARPRDSNEQDKQTGAFEGEARDGTGGNHRGRGRRGGARPRDSSGEQDKQTGALEGEGRESSVGNHRGRGRRGGNNYRKDRATAKHFAGLGGY